MRASPAITFADSIRQTASMTRLMSVAVTDTNQPARAERCKDSSHAGASLDATPDRHGHPEMHDAPRSM
jgi:hypothetical protein